MSVCLDAFALLAWLQDEPGAKEIEKYLERTVNEKDFICYVSTLNLGEVYYRLFRVRGVDEAQAFWEDAKRGSLPVNLVEPTRNRIREAALIKGQYPVALADAFATQVAREKNVPLVTGDPDFRILEEKGLLSIIWL